MTAARRDNSQAEYTIRPTDNGAKPGDMIAPQTSGLLELDDNGLPVDFATWAVVTANGER